MTETGPKVNTANRILAAMFGLARALRVRDRQAGGYEYEIQSPPDDRDFEEQARADEKRRRKAAKRKEEGER